MPQLSLRNLSFTWGGSPLLDGIDLEIDKGERIGLLGRNGAGKSTLLRLIAGEIEPDDGEIRIERGLQIARLVQEVPREYDGPVASLVEEGWDSADGRTSGQAGAFAEVGPTAERTAADDSIAGGWRVAQGVDRVLSLLKLNGNDMFGGLSSGMKRRVLLARALVGEPGLLLLDEPTNHLDIESIDWLERFLKGFDGSLVFVTHDRVFLQALATRIVEIDRGRLFDWTCDYATFLKRKQAAFDAEDKQNAEFDRKLAKEEAWIRQGIKARRTRNEGRVRALKRMREERRQRRRRIGNVRMQAFDAQRSGQLVIEADDVAFAYGERTIVGNLSTLVTRGDKIGIIGPNGSGKTTLLKLLLGELQPAAGTIRHGTRLEPIYFDQLREQIDEDRTVVENVADGQDTLLIGGQKRHIYGYLQDFLFTAERARRPARFLSGGERSRLLLARLFQRPSNVMVLDEPTNDLDTETLELLEELVSDYSGTLLLVSHARPFLHNVVTSTLVFEGDGRVTEYAGGYDDYVRQRDASQTSQSESAKPAKKRKPGKRSKDRQDKLSFHEQRELESLPHTIDGLERQQDEMHAAMAEPTFFKQNGSEIAQARQRLDSLEQELARLYARWEELEART